MKLFTFIFLNTLACLTLRAEDTTFIRRLPISEGIFVQNITSDLHNLYVRTSDSIYKWDKGELTFFSLGHNKFSWLESDPNGYYWNHTDYIDETKQARNNIAEYLLPGKSNTTMNMALIGNNSLYVCYGGMVLEYRINREYTRVHKGRSIRNIYAENGFRMISTYSGVFLDTNYQIFSTENLGDKPEFYSNGKFCKIDSLYFLCQHDLLIYNPISRKFDFFFSEPAPKQFRNIVKVANNCFGIRADGISLINLTERSIEKEIIRAEIIDAVTHGQYLYAISANGIYYRIESNGSFTKYSTAYKFNEVASINGKLYFGTVNSLLEHKSGSFKPIIEGHEIIEVIAWENTIFFTNNSGLYAIINGNVIPFITGAEFNKHALAADGYMLYAGSVDGLYCFEKFKLNNWIAVRGNETPHFKSDSSNLTTYNIVIGLLLIVSFMVLLIYFVLKRKKGEVETEQIKRKIDVERIRSTIKSNPNIKSVVDIANELNVSTSTLRRTLAKENTNPLDILKDVKKEICFELIENRENLSTISKRTGYSVRYIKENFLRDR